MLDTKHIFLIDECADLINRYMRSFKLNKYTRWYYSIISKAQVSLRTKSIGYFESHHIIPKCLGGTNSKCNLVLLTAKEHFICHLLLPKMVTNVDEKIKLTYAYLSMGRKNKYQPTRVTSSQYAFFRKAFADSLKGREITKATRLKMSINNGQRCGKDNTFYGKKHTQEFKQKMSIFAKQNVTGLIWITKDNENKRIRDHELDQHILCGWKRGRKLSPEHSYNVAIAGTANLKRGRNLGRI